MFQKGQILKYNLDKFDRDHKDLDPVIHTSLRRLAEEYRFEILEVNPQGYKLKRIDDGKENTFSKQETEASLVPAT